MKWYSIGSLTIPASWAAIVIAFLLVSIYLHFRADKKANDWYSNAIFIFIAVWKLSVLIFQYKLSVANPFNILYFHGGFKGYLLGFAAAILYTLYRKYRFDLNLKSSIRAWVLTVFLYEIFLWILNGEQTLLIILQLATGAIFIWVLMKKTTITWHVQVLILFTSIQVLIYSFKNDLLSTPIGTYIIMALVLSIIPNLEAKK